jgi:hypothetical protein
MPDERVDLVGQRHGRPGDGAASPSSARRRRARGLDGRRQVVVVDRLPHRLGLPFAGVDAAHRALQFGELAHHVRRRGRPWQSSAAAFGVIGATSAMAERRRPRSSAPVAPGAIRLGAVAAERLVEQPRWRADRAVLLQRCLAIRVPEEARVAQARRSARARALIAIFLGFSGSMLSTARKAGISLPCSSTTGKKCWWWIIVVVSTSAGSCRNSSGNVPETTTGYSTRSGTSARASCPAGVTSTRPPSASGFGVELTRDHPRRGAPAAFDA